MTATVDTPGDVDALLDDPARRAHGARGGRCATPPTVRASPSRPRCSSRSRCCAATAAATARSPSRRRASMSPVPRRSTRCSPSPARGAALGCHEALFTLGEAPEDRYPVAAEWLAAHGYASTVDYLVAACRGRARRDRPAPPRQRRRARREAELERLRAVSPVAGDDDRDARRPPRRARRPAPRRARQDPGAAAGHARGRGPGRGCRSPPASSSASARRAPSASTRSLAIAATRTRATATCRR